MSESAVRVYVFGKWLAGVFDNFSKAEKAGVTYLTVWTTNVQMETQYDMGTHMVVSGGGRTFKGRLWKTVSRVLDGAIWTTYTMIVDEEVQS